MVKDVVPTVVNEGILNSILGVEVASRFKLSTPFSPLIDLMRGEFKAEDLAGVHGNFIGYLPAVYQNLQEGMPLLHAILSALPVSGLSNLYKGLVLYPDEGKSYRGQVSVSLDSNAEEYGGDTGNILKRSTGFKPLAQHRKEQEIDRDAFWERQFAKHTPKYTARMERKYLKFLKADSEKERAKAFDSFDKARIDLYDYYVSKNMPKASEKVKNATQRAIQNAILKMRADAEDIVNKKRSLYVKQKRLEYTQE
jgi:hypothetical protein